MTLEYKPNLISVSDCDIMYELWLYCMFFLSKGAVSVNYGDARIGGMRICNDKNYTLRATAELKNFTDGQAVKVLMYMTEEFGNDNKYSCKAYKFLGGKKKLIVNISGKGACNALNTYGSKIWWEVEELLGNTKPSYCPVEAKTYSMDWYRIKYSEIAVMALVPDGAYAIDCRLTDMKGKVLKACLAFDVVKTS